MPRTPTSTIGDMTETPGDLLPVGTMTIADTTTGDLPLADMTTEDRRGTTQVATLPGTTRTDVPLVAGPPPRTGVHALEAAWQLDPRYQRSPSSESHRPSSLPPRSRKLLPRQVSRILAQCLSFPYSLSSELQTEETEVNRLDD